MKSLHQRGFWFCFIYALVFWGCSKQDALFLTITADSPVKIFDLRVMELDSNKIVLNRVGEQIDPVNPNRDISKPGQELKVVIKVAKAGQYLVHIVASTYDIPAKQFFFIKSYFVSGILEIPVHLVFLQNDVDKDGFPACGTFGTNCESILNIDCERLDCDDSDFYINPFHIETLMECGNGVDEDCSAGCSGDPSKGDIQCVDADGDGALSNVDCDDNDPCRSPSNVEASNTCNLSGGFPLLPQSCLDKLAIEGKKELVVPYCNDEIDQDCDGNDAACDLDCDGYYVPGDCDDNNDKINQGAQEKCGDGVDNNCNKIVDEGCLPCDVDSDGFEHEGSGCAPQPDEVDADDYDSGINPDTTSDTNEQEGGSAKTALREFCSYEQEKNGQTHRDIDHDGDGKKASEDGCPSVECDVDGDGFSNAQCNPPPPASKKDCDDSDPSVFPGAPDKCGDGKAQNCNADTLCSFDKDNDGYNSNDGDCDNNNAQIHPWAIEICDGLDNDCDGLIDEGNPDSDGNLLPTNVGNCNDDNDGVCGELKGICVCSLRTPNSEPDNGNRIACDGEDFNKAASPRCFGAIQPGLEICDGLDNDCNSETVDGDKECPLLNLTCCSGQGQCRDLFNDLQNCGTCGNQCDDSNECSDDTCSSGQCTRTFLSGDSCNQGNGICQNGVCVNIDAGVPDAALAEGGISDGGALDIGTDAADAGVEVGVTSDASVDSAVDAGVDLDSTVDGQ